MPTFKFLSLFTMILLVSCNVEKELTPQDYPIKPVSFTEVDFEDQFWKPLLLLHQDKTLTYTLDQCEHTGRINNFRRAADIQEGSFCTIYPFDDSDVFKIMEGVAYSLQVNYDEELDARLDSLIELIGAAQEPDGYLYTNRTINPDSTHAWAGPERWLLTDDLSHELYNLGHLYEAAAAHFTATGKRNLLDIALKSADLVDNDFGWGKLEKTGGHQVIEMGLVKLYRITGDRKYLDLATFFLDVRGPDGEEYSQAHKKVVDQREAVGHAVRAMYMYAGMADVAALTGRADYIEALKHIWEDVVNKKMYITGGIGATGGNEGFANPYILPNFSAYCETCASIAYVFWNYRMFLLHGDAKYIDVMERTLYNALRAGLSDSGDRFFYPNPLESRKNHERSPWFNCACCPSNLARFLPGIPGYQYATMNNDIYVNLFVAGKASIDLLDGQVMLSQEGNYPIGEQQTIEINASPQTPFRVLIRIPGWSLDQPVPGDLYRFDQPSGVRPIIKVNGVEFPYQIEKGYAVLDHTWGAEDRVEVRFPMEIRKVMAHDSVMADRDHFAWQRGPIVFCAEGKDQVGDERTIHYRVPLATNAVFQEENDAPSNQPWGIAFKGLFYGRNIGKDALSIDEMPMFAIPYYKWANRGRDYMNVWFPYEENAVRPAPAPTLAYLSEKSATDEFKGSLEALGDQMVPRHSKDRSNPFVHWWPARGTTHSVTYTFETPIKVSFAKVYWFDDQPEGGCRLPASWEVQVKRGKEWIPVTGIENYPVTQNAFDEVTFDPVITKQVRLVITAPENGSVGLFEWIVE